MADERIAELRSLFRDLRNAAATLSSVYLFIAFLCVQTLAPPGHTQGVPPHDLELA